MKFNYQEKKIENVSYYSFSVGGKTYYAYDPNDIPFYDEPTHIVCGDARLLIDSLALIPGKGESIISADESLVKEFIIKRNEKRIKLFKGKKFDQISTNTVKEIKNGVCDYGNDSIEYWPHSHKTWLDIISYSFNIIFLFFLYFSYERDLNMHYSFEAWGITYFVLLCGILVWLFIQRLNHRIKEFEKIHYCSTWVITNWKRSTLVRNIFDFLLPLSFITLYFVIWRLFSLDIFLLICLTFIIILILSHQQRKKLLHQLEEFIIFWNSRDK
jgi:hypothetical protein